LLEASQSINEEESANLLAKAFQLVYQLPLVSMAYIQGAAMGGGAGLACACDFILIDENAFISFPEVRRGLVPAQVLVLLKKQLNEKQLKEVVLLGEKIKSDKAYEMGLVTKVIPSDNIEAALLTFANQFLKGSPEAIQQTKCLINKLSSRLLSEEFDIAQKFHHLSRQSIHAKEGMKAFLEKRKASWEI
jgi:methylglutaconyl-CoA hydratase